MLGIDKTVTVTVTHGHGSVRKANGTLIDLCCLVTGTGTSGVTKGGGGGRKQAEPVHRRFQPAHRAEFSELK